MSNKDTNEVLDHEYDGIQEYDNPLPNWWLATFYGAIIYTFFYVGYYHFGSGPSPEMELESDLAAIQAAKQLEKGTGPTLSEEDLLAVFNDNAKRTLGATVFKEKCASCHGGQGEGQIGPNLTDNFWLHGNGSLLGIHQAVSDGIPEKGMPPWKGMLKKEEVQNVVAYVHGLKGSKPANAKPPQGNEVVSQ